MKQEHEVSVNRTRTCTWVLVNASRGVNAIYCNRPVGYTYVMGEDATKIRNYDILCPLHQDAIRKQKQTLRDKIASGELSADDYDDYDLY